MQGREREKKRIKKTNNAKQKASKFKHLRLRRPLPALFVYLFICSFICSFISTAHKGRGFHPRRLHGIYSTNCTRRRGKGIVIKKKKKNNNHPKNQTNNNSGSSGRTWRWQLCTFPLPPLAASLLFHLPPPPDDFGPR